MGSLSLKLMDMRIFRRGWTSFLLLLTSLPYLLFWWQTPPNEKYSWIIPPYPDDSFAYMAWTRQAINGNLLFQIKYTALPHKAFFFHPLFLLCGWISRLFGLDIGIVHWAVKCVGVLLFFLAFYRYLDYLKLSPLSSVVASVLVGISSGFGGIFASWNLATRWQVLPADLWMPEMSTFWALLWNPLFPYSLALLVLIIYWLDRGARDGQARDFWQSGLAVGLMALLHPYALPLLFAYATILTFVRQTSRAIGFLLRFSAASLPLVFYVGLLSLLQPVLAQHSASGAMNSPHPLEYFLGFGLPILLCATGLAVHPGLLMKRYWQLFLWFFLSFGFAYLPFWFQRKLIFGAQIPLCILAAISVELVLSRISPGPRRWVLATIFLVFPPFLVSTPVYLIYNEAAEVSQNANGNYYISNDEREGLNFLKAHSRPDEVVFASYETSRMIPAYAGNTVVWGHWAMSVDLEERKRWMAALFNPHSIWHDPQRSKDFWGTDIHYLYADGKVRDSIRRSPEFWRVILDDADEVFANDSVLIYKHREIQQ